MAKNRKSHHIDQRIDIVNSILHHVCHINLQVSSIKECSPSMFVLLLEHLFDVKHLRGVVPSPSQPNDHIHNAAQVLQHVETILGYSVDINPLDIFKRRTTALCDLIDIFAVLRDLVSYLKKESSQEYISEISLELEDDSVSTPRSSRSSSTHKSSSKSSSSTGTKSSNSKMKKKDQQTKQNNNFQPKFDFEEDRRLRSLYNRTMSNMDAHSRKLNAEDMREAQRLHSKKMHDMRLRDIQAARDADERMRMLQRTRMKMRNEHDKLYKDMYQKIQKLEKERVMAEKTALKERQNKIDRETKLRRQDIANFHEEQINSLREEFSHHQKERHMAEKTLRWDMERTMRELRQKHREEMKREQERLLSEEDARFHRQKKEMEKYVDKLYNSNTRKM
eukprot:gb/GECH01013647.1/.p1 GENE.gb/GECH01013647.1/~~gb/GECH01013647.1/.p1  ORF type:complete len:392 (+),score=101.20 gb/GECH01013647.1/:1-1176(+)